MDATTIHWHYRIEWKGMHGYAVNGLELDQMIQDVLLRVDQMSDIKIEVIFGGTTTT